MNSEWSEKKVVVDEDEPTLALMARRYLESHGATVWVEGNGMLGLKRIREVMPDAVVMDLVMPVMDGCEALTEIRSDPKLAHLHVIVTTTQTDDTEMYRECLSKADIYLIKPYDPHDLRPA